jgi:hypothetical protein
VSVIIVWPASAALSVAEELDVHGTPSSERHSRLMKNVLPELKATRHRNDRSLPREIYSLQPLRLPADALKLDAKWNFSKISAHHKCQTPNNLCRRICRSRFPKILLERYDLVFERNTAVLNCFVDCPPCLLFSPLITNPGHCNGKCLLNTKSINPGYPV